MTIAIGIVASDGLVMAADSLVSTGNYMKGDDSKLAGFGGLKRGEFRAGNPQGMCIVAGAGSAGHVKALTAELGLVFLENPYIPGPRALVDPGQECLQLKFEECMKRFYQEHVIPFALFPYEERPDVEMLIGTLRDSSYVLYATEKTTVTEVMARYKAIGMGSIYADLLLRGLFKSEPLESVEMLAAYVVFMVKESVEGCGNFTLIHTIRNQPLKNPRDGQETFAPQFSFVSSDKIREWERLFQTEWVPSQKSLVWDLIEKGTKQSVPRKSRGKHE